MKYALKSVTLLITGLLTAIIIYPFLHEMGHALAAMCCGARVVSFELFPLPLVVCQMNTTGAAVIFAGFGGMLLPFLATCIYTPQNFVCWYVGFVTKGICLLSFLISLAALVLFQTGLPIQNEDITRVMLYAPQYSGLYYAVLLILSAATLVQLFKGRPIRKCEAFFGV